MLKHEVFAAADDMAGTENAVLPAVPERARPADFPSDKKRRDALDLFEHGLGYMRTAQILDLNPETVRGWERRWQNGTFRAELARNQYRYSDDTKARCIEMRQSGTPWHQIARETGVSVSAVRKWVKAAGEASGEAAGEPPEN